jgi:hypothetical protein
MLIRESCVLGQVPEWTKGADCKSVAIGFQGSNPCLPTKLGVGAFASEVFEWQSVVHAGRA